MLKNFVYAKKFILIFTLLLASSCGGSGGMDSTQPATPDVTPPATIMNLVADNTTISSMRLTWTAPGNNGNTGMAASYDIRYSTSPLIEATWESATRVAGVTAPQAPGTIETRNITGLSSETTYYFGIKTADEVPNISALSNVAIGTTIIVDVTSPATIANLVVDNATINSIRLTWNAPGNNGNTGIAASYDIRYSTSLITEANWASATQVTGEPAPLVAGTAQTMTITGLSSGTTYYFGIKTTDEVPNISALSNVAIGTTIIVDVTSPATIASLVADNATINSIRLTWNAPGDDGIIGIAASYDIRYSTSLITEANWASATQVTGEPAPLVAGTAQTTTITGLSSGTTYYFGIKTADDVPNTSALSVASGTTIIVDVTPPATIASLVADNATINSIRLTWNAPGDDGIIGIAASYDIRYSTSTITEANWASATQATVEPAPQVAGTVQTTTITGLSSGTTYYFGIKTADDVPNTSALSNVASGTTIIVDVTPPATITDLTAGNATISSITLTWTAPGDDGAIGTAASYDIRYSTATITEANWASATQVAGVPAPQGAGTVQTTTITGLSSGTTYYFGIKTADDVPNISALSNVASGTTTGIPAITSFAAVAASSSQINLSWSASGTGIDSYLVWNNQIGGYIYSGPDTTFSHAGLNPGTLYEYVVWAHNSAGWSVQTVQSEASAATMVVQADVFVDPPTKTVNNGDTFDINVIIDPHGISISGAQANIAFDPAILHVNSITEGNLFKQGGLSTFFSGGTLDNTAGTVKNTFCVIMGPYNVTTSGTYLIINATAIGSGTSGISLSNVKISSPAGTAVPLNTANGSVTVP